VIFFGSDELDPIAQNRLKKFKNMPIYYRKGLKEAYSDTGLNNLS